MSECYVEGVSGLKQYGKSDCTLSGSNYAAYLYFPQGIKYSDIVQMRITHAPSGQSARKQFKYSDTQYLESVTSANPKDIASTATEILLPYPDAYSSSLYDSVTEVLIIATK